MEITTDEVKPTGCLSASSHEEVHKNEKFAIGKSIALFKVFAELERLKYQSDISKVMNAYIIQYNRVFETRRHAHKWHQSPQPTRWRALHILIKHIILFSVADRSRYTLRNFNDVHRMDEISVLRKEVYYYFRCLLQTEARPHHVYTKVKAASRVNTWTLKNLKYNTWSKTGGHELATQIFTFCSFLLLKSTIYEMRNSFASIFMNARCCYVLINRAAAAFSPISPALTAPDFFLAFSKHLWKQLAKATSSTLYFCLWSQKDQNYIAVWSALSFFASQIPPLDKQSESKASYISEASRFASIFLSCVPQGSL